jgi:hypothetical protein
MITRGFMKNASLIAATTLLALGLSHTGSAQGPQGRSGPPAAPTITTLAGDVQVDWAAQKELFVNAADAMPDDTFGYKPTPAQRSYGEQIMHVVQANQSVVGMLGGKTPAPAINLKAATKAEVMTALRLSMDHWDVVLKEFTDQQLNERVAAGFMGPSASRLRLIYGSMQHTYDIYGQMVVYLRLNGIVPPASRRGGL